MLGARTIGAVLAVWSTVAVPTAGSAIRPDAPPACPPGRVCDAVALHEATGRFRTLGPAGERAWYFGDPGDHALLGDWDCDGTATPALYRRSTGFVYLRDDLTAGPAARSFYLGDPGDVPVAGDFDGDGCDTIGVYRGAEGRFYARNALGAGVADLTYYFGNPGDRPFAGDFDGDGIDTLGLHRPATGFLYFSNHHRTGLAEHEFHYGDPGDVLLAGDWDGNGRDTFAVYRPSDGRVHVRLVNEPGVADYTLLAGSAVAALAWQPGPPPPDAALPPDAAPPPEAPPPPAQDPAPPPSEPAPPPAAPRPPEASGTWHDAAWAAGLGADVDRTAAAVTLHVDPTASDANPGTAAAPFRTIGAAIDRAQDLRRDGLGVRVVVAAGTYRESLDVTGPNLAGPDPVLVVEAATPGTVVVTGADPIGGWQPASGGTWQAPWPHDWGLADVPSGWDAVTVPEEVRRRELLVAGGAVVHQVLSPADLRPGTFHVDQAAGTVTLHPADPHGFDPTGVEAATRDELLRVLLTDHVAVDGIEFRHANPALGDAVKLLESEHVELNRVTVTATVWGGIQLYDAHQVTLRDVAATGNGGRGIGLARSTGLLFERVDASANNWRGAPAGFTGWSVAGIKAHHLGDALLRDVTADDNLTRGLWLDSNNRRILVAGGRLCGNATDGLFVEASQGPIRIEGTTICDNARHGVMSANATGVDLARVAICGSGEAAVELSGLGSRRITDPDTGAELTLPAAAGWAINDSLLRAGGGPLVGTTLGADDVAGFTATLAAAGNRWESGAEQPFRLAQHEPADFAAWLAATGEAGSSFGPPGASGCGR